MENRWTWTSFFYLAVLLLPILPALTSYAVDTAEKEFSTGAEVLKSENTPRKSVSLVTLQPELFWAGATAVRYSPDGHNLLTANSNTMLLWDVATKRVIRSFSLPLGEAIHTALFGKGGQVVIAVGPTLTRGWNIDSGEVVHDVSSPAVIYTAALGTDGDTLALGSDHSVYLYSLAAGKTIKLLDASSEFEFGENELYAVSFSPDMRLCAAAGRDNLIRIWNISHPAKRDKNDIVYQITGVEEIHPLQVLAGHKRDIVSLDFSPDNNLLASAGKDGEVRIWQTQSGALFKQLSHEPDDGITSLFSPDNRFLAVSGTAGGIDLWRISDWHLERSIVADSSYVLSFDFSPNSHRLVSSGTDGIIRFWNVATGYEVSRIERNRVPVEQLMPTLDGTRLIIQTPNGPLIWDIKQGYMMQNTPGQNIPSSIISPDLNKLIVQHPKSKTISLQDVLSGKTAQWNLSEIDTPEYSKSMISRDGHFFVLESNKRKYLRIINLEKPTESPVLIKDDAGFLSFRLSPNGSLLATVNYQAEVKLWDFRKGRLLHCWPPSREYMHSIPHSSSPSATKKRIALNQRIINTWLWHKNVPVTERTGLVGNRHKREKLLDLLESSWKDGKGFLSVINDIAFSPDSSFLAAAGDHTGVRIWNTKTGEQIRGSIGENRSIEKISFSADGNFLICKGSGALAKVNWRSGETIWSVDNTPSGQWLPLALPTLAVAPDGRLIFTADNTVVTIHNAATGEEVAKLVTFLNGEWIILTPEGYYNASPEGDTFLNVRTDDTGKILQADQYRPLLYQPDRVTARLAGSPALIENALEKLPVQPPVITVLRPEIGVVHKDTVEIEVDVDSKDEPVKVDFFINGKKYSDSLHSQKKAMPRTGNRRHFSFAVHLDPGKNIILLRVYTDYTFSEKSMTLFRATDIVSQKKSSLYILAIGVAEYPNLNQDDQLLYSDDDAKAFAALFSRQSEYYEDIHARVLVSGGNPRPTREQILQELGFLNQANEDDTVILFLAGHGARDQEGHYFFWPENASRRNGQLDTRTAVTGDEIRKALRIKAKRRLVFLDTCKSGTFIESDHSLVVDSNRITRQLLADGLFVFTASSGIQTAAELRKLKHGIFTYALLEGLRGRRADFYKDDPEQITMKELDLYVSKRVQELSHAQQTAKSYAPGGYEDFVVWHM